jgi:hypothetical protein
MDADATPEALSRRPAPSLLISASRAGSPRPLDGRRCIDGAAQAPPRTTLLIRGSKPDPRRVRTGAPDHRVRNKEGTRIRAVPRALQLEGAPHVVFESQRGQLAGGSHRGRASAPSVPSEWDRAPPSKPTQALQWTCLWTTQPTLIERGMGVHSNHPPAAQRGIRNPRPARWGLRKPHPPSRGGTARARQKTSRKALPDRLERAQARGLDARLHLLDCTHRR